MEKHLEEYEKEVKELCETRLNVSKLKSTDPWTIDDLNLAIKDLDNGKARDALGHANELFKQEVAGTDLLLRSILDRLMYNELYETIDHALTDGNVGARKERNIRDNLFVLGAVINSVVNGNQEPMQIQVMDIEKCFDKLWLEAPTNALFDAGVNF